MAIQKEKTKTIFTCWPTWVRGSGKKTGGRQAAETPCGNAVRQTTVTLQAPCETTARKSLVFVNKILFCTLKHFPFYCTACANQRSWSTTRKSPLFFTFSYYFLDLTRVTFTAMNKQNKKKSCACCCQARREPQLTRRERPSAHRDCAPTGGKSQDLARSRLSPCIPCNLRCDVSPTTPHHLYGGSLYL